MTHLSDEALHAGLKLLVEHTSRIKESTEGEEHRTSRLYDLLDVIPSTLLQPPSVLYCTMVPEDAQMPYGTLASKVPDGAARSWPWPMVLLHYASREYLPQADWLLENLPRLGPTVDFSPAVLQYCRALENEILQKLFVAYTADVRGRMPKCQQLFADAERDARVRRFSGNLRNDRAQYTLGEMSVIMGMIRPGGETLRQTELLQDFQRFTLTYFKEHVLSQRYLGSLDLINAEYRRKSAHPYLLDEQSAHSCRGLVVDALSELFESYRPGFVDGRDF